MTLTFQPQNHIISRISQGYSLYQVWTLWDHSFLSYAPNISVKKVLMNMWHWPFNLKTTPFLGYPKVIPHTNFQHFGIFRFWAMLRTNKWTRTLPTNADWLSAWVIKASDDRHFLHVTLFCHSYLNRNQQQPVTYIKTHSRENDTLILSRHWDSARIPR